MTNKKWITFTAASAAALGLALGAFAAQGGSSSDIDTLKVRQEMETMEGILKTSIRFATRSASDEEIEFHGIGQDIRGYFLLGQGAVFIIPVAPSESRANLEAVLALETSVRDAEKQRVLSEGFLRDIEREVRDALRDAESAERDAMHAFGLRFDGMAPPLPPEPPEPDDAPESPEAVLAPGEPPPPPAPGAPTAARTPTPAPTPRQTQARAAGETRRRAEAVDAQKRLQALQQRLEERKADTEKRLKELEADLARLREGLIDTLAKHGDSLTILRPEDSITLILSREGLGVPLGRVFWIGGGSKREETNTTVLSVRKSAISDYKAGRLSRDQFLQKVLQYQQ